MTGKVPQNLMEYFEALLSQFSSATTLVVFDPIGYLNLPREYRDPTGKNWRVYHYCENDLEFRREYSERPSDPNFSSIIWVTLSTGKNEVNLSFIPDVLAKADKIIDLGIEEVLNQLAPNEIWPKTIFEYQEEISDNLPGFYRPYRDLRQKIRLPLRLNKNHIIAIILACRNPELRVEELIFEELDAVDLLKHYLKIVWAQRLRAEDVRLLKTLILESSRVGTDQIYPWLREKDDELAIFLYSLAILKEYEVINPVTLLRGMGVLGFSPEEIQNQADELLSSLKKSGLLWENLIRTAEESLSLEDMDRIMMSLILKEPVGIAQAILKESSPLLVFSLTLYFLKRIVSDKLLDKESLSWIKGLDSHPILQDAGPTTKFTFPAKEALSFLREIGFVEMTIDEPFQERAEITSLIDWYEQTQAYRLQLALAKANGYLRVIDNQDLKRSLAGYLENLRKRVSEFLSRADINLAELIEKDLGSYFSHPRLSVNVLKDYILKSGIKPTNQSRLWVLIFDGMRLDTWKEVVKPLISSKFEISAEKLYLCPLPSYTEIARVSLLAGKLPPYWKDYRGHQTTDHNILASKLFGLSRETGKRDLRIVVASETDYSQRKLDLEIRPYNILIYNLSDDWIHTFKDDVWELNQTIKGKLERSILQDLEGRIGEDDYVVITSDHGFIELERDKEIKIDEPEQSAIIYRYLDNIERPEGVKIQYEDGFFTVARGRNWFGRLKGRFNRYSHGGISLDEMVVPGVTLKKLVRPAIKIKMRFPKETIEVNEDELSKINLVIENTGNKLARFTLLMQLDSGEEKRYDEELIPQKCKECFLDFMPSLRTRNLQLFLTYKDEMGREIRESRRLNIKVVERKDKIKIDTSALDRLEEL